MASGTLESWYTTKSSTSAVALVTTCLPALLLVSLSALAACVIAVLTNFLISGQPTKKMDLGETEIPEEMFMELLKDLAPRFTEATYNVLKHNCNNFTDEVA